MKKTAIFLDRDGTINKDIGYLYKIEDWQWLIGVQESLAELVKRGYILIVITNQSGIARGYYKEIDMDLLHDWVNKELLAYNCQITAFYHCPHHPDFTGICKCRKPSAGLILQAAKEHNIDLSSSYMIGDKISDIEAGQAAKCKTILLSTACETEDICVASNLADATQRILLRKC